MPAAERTWVEIGERRLTVSNLDKVLYPLVGFTKAQVIDYYVRIAPTMLHHIGDRGVTLRRWRAVATSRRRPWRSSISIRERRRP